MEWGPVFDVLMFYFLEVGERRFKSQDQAKVRFSGANPTKNWKHLPGDKPPGHPALRGSRTKPTEPRVGSDRVSSGNPGILLSARVEPENVSSTFRPKTGNPPRSRRFSESSTHLTRDQDGAEDGFQRNKIFHRTSLRGNLFNNIHIAQCIKGSERCTTDTVHSYGTIRNCSEDTVCTNGTSSTSKQFSVGTKCTNITFKQCSVNTVSASGTIDDCRKLSFNYEQKVSTDPVEPSSKKSHRRRKSIDQEKSDSNDSCRTIKGGRVVKDDVKDPCRVVKGDVKKPCRVVKDDVTEPCRVVKIQAGFAFVNLIENTKEVLV